MTRSQATPSPVADQEGLLNDPNFLREGLRRFLQQFPDEEIAQFLQAEPYERTEDRQDYLNGCKPRQLTMWVRRIELAVPQDRAGCFQSELFERYQRPEKALVLALQQSYLQGVSTRKGQGHHGKAVRHALFQVAGVVGPPGAGYRHCSLADRRLSRIPIWLSMRAMSTCAKIIRWCLKACSWSRAWDKMGIGIC